ncbi:MAG: hypothetical protein OXG37_01015 [Actinomycetia bacterium]|nr:hypothetical protein [Actinomycetes bacterium]
MSDQQATREPVRRPVVELEPCTYQPSKAELEADISIDATPDDLAEALMADVEVVTRPER